MENKILVLTEKFVRKELGTDSSGHDWYHIERVWKNALSIWEREQKGNRFIIEMASLLHDISDEKLNDSAESGKNKLNQFLFTLNIEEHIRLQILEIIDSISFKGGQGSPVTTIEAKIVQDADRLDAIGAVGIARTFAYGGKKGHLIYDPLIKTREEMTEEEYRKGKSSSLHHFYEKLLKLKDLMNTDTGRKIAENRHHFMETFLRQFYSEWDGKS